MYKTQADYCLLYNPFYSICTRQNTRLRGIVKDKPDLFPVYYKTNRPPSCEYMSKTPWPSVSHPHSDHDNYTNMIINIYDWSGPDLGFVLGEIAIKVHKFEDIRFFTLPLFFCLLLKFWSSVNLHFLCLFLLEWVAVYWMLFGSMSNGYKSDQGIEKLIISKNTVGRSDFYGGSIP